MNYQSQIIQAIEKTFLGNLVQQGQQELIQLSNDDVFVAELMRIVDTKLFSIQIRLFALILFKQYVQADRLSQLQILTVQDSLLHAMYRLSDEDLLILQYEEILSILFTKNYMGETTHYVHQTVLYNDSLPLEQSLSYLRYLYVYYRQLRNLQTESILFDLNRLMEKMLANLQIIGLRFLSLRLIKLVVKYTNVQRELKQLIFSFLPQINQIQKTPVNELMCITKINLHLVQRNLPKQVQEGLFYTYLQLLQISERKCLYSVLKLLYTVIPNNLDETHLDFITTSLFNIIIYFNDEDLINDDHLYAVYSIEEQGYNHYDCRQYACLILHKLKSLDYPVALGYQMKQNIDAMLFLLGQDLISKTGEYDELIQTYGQKILSLQVSIQIRLIYLSIKYHTLYFTEDQIQFLFQYQPVQVKYFVLKYIHYFKLRFDWLRDQVGVLYQLRSIYQEQFIYEMCLKNSTIQNDDEILILVEKYELSQDENKDLILQFILTYVNCSFNIGSHSYQIIITLILRILNQDDDRFQTCLEIIRRLMIMTNFINIWVFLEMNHERFIYLIDQFNKLGQLLLYGLRSAPPMPPQNGYKMIELANSIYDFNDSEDDTDSILITTIINQLVYMKAFEDLECFNQMNLNLNRSDLLNACKSILILQLQSSISTNEQQIGQAQQQVLQYQHLIFQSPFLCRILQRYIPIRYDQTQTEVDDAILSFNELTQEL